MVKQGGGRIIQIGSISGQRGNMGGIAYGASKAAVMHICKVLAVELSGQGVMVNAIAPGPIETGLSRHGPTRRQGYLDRIPTHSYGNVDAVANAALYLASDECDWVTGHILNVDGGYGAAGLSYDPAEIADALNANGLHARFPHHAELASHQARSLRQAWHGGFAMQERVRGRRRGARCRRQRHRCGGRHRAGAGRGRAVEFAVLAASVTRWFIARARPAPKPWISGRPRRRRSMPSASADRQDRRRLVRLARGRGRCQHPRAAVLRDPLGGGGLAEMHGRWGRLPLAEIAAPSVALAKRGLPQDWYTTLKIAVSAPVLRKYPESARIYLRDGLPPVPPYQGALSYFRLGRLSETLDRLARAGWRDFYRR